MDVEELKKEVARIKWWHSIDLGHGIVTPGMHKTPERLSLIGLPKDLSGRSVLDIGAWDGFYSFEAERRGASRVLAVDSFSWGGDGWGTQDGFNLVRRALNSRVEDQNLEVLDLSPERVGTFDLVLFLGVLYHMRHPLLSLERVFSVTKNQLILETHVEELPTEKPAMVFYPNRELDGDDSNWWGPNAAAVEAMLRVVGFSKVELTNVDPPLPPGPPPEVKPRTRMVFHAWR